MKCANALLAGFSLLSLVALASCEKKTEAETAPVPVTVTPIVQKDVFVMNTWVGLLTGYQNADIRAQVTGYLLTQNYKEGSTVKKGTVLFTIDKRPFEAALAQAQADYAKSVATAQLAQITLDRQTTLYKTKVISQQEYDTAYQTAQADVAGAAAAQANVQTAQINLTYCTITAPFDGIVGLAQAQIGDLVGPSGTSSELTQMSQVNPIKVNFSITEEEYLEAYELLQKLQARDSTDKVPAKLELKLANGDVYPQKGTFDFVNRQVNTATGTIQITGLFPNDDDLLRPGLFGRVTAPVDELKDALVVPQDATVEQQGIYMVSVLKPDNTVQPVPVKLGPPDGQQMQVVISPNLKVGMKVVVGGIEKARPGLTVSQSAYVPPPAPTPSPTRPPKKLPSLTPTPAPAETPAATATPTPAP